MPAEVLGLSREFWGATPLLVRTARRVLREYCHAITAVLFCRWCRQMLFIRAGFALLPVTFVAAYAVAFVVGRSTRAAFFRRTRAQFAGGVTHLCVSGDGCGFVEPQLVPA